MNRILTLTLLLLAAPLVQAGDPACPETLDYTFRPLGGEQPARLCEAHRGKVVLVVNTASRCGYTYQYEGLEALYARYRERGLDVIGFPSNDFGGQEPGTEQEIATFCRSTYGVQFPMYEKTHARAGGAHPFFARLAADGGYPRWNFHKYLLDRDGRVVASFGSGVEPLDRELVGRIEELL